MTNKEKANEIIYSHKNDPRWFMLEHGASEQIALLEMAEWKDQQFKEYLEKKKNELQEMSNKDFYDISSAFGGCKYISEIIDELFGED